MYDLFFNAIENGDTVTIDRVLRNEPSIAAMINLPDNRQVRKENICFFCYSILNPCCSQRIFSQASSSLNPLMLATKLGHIPVMASLMSNGADINHQTIFGSTAFHVACQRGKMEAAIFLVQRGIDINILDMVAKTQNCTYINRFYNFLFLLTIILHKQNRKTAFDFCSGERITSKVRRLSSEEALILQVPQLMSSYNAQN